MRFPESPYIDQQNERVRIAGTRVSLSSIIVHFRAGQTPDQIVDSFPTVMLAQVHGAIAYYLENEGIIDEYFAEVQRKFEQLVRPLSETNPELFTRLEAAREKMASKRA